MWEQLVKKNLKNPSFHTRGNTQHEITGQKRAALNINYIADAFASVLNGRERKLEAVCYSSSNGRKIGDFSRQSA